MFSGGSFYSLSLAFNALQWSAILLCRVALLYTEMLQCSTWSDCAEMSRRLWKPLGMSAEVCQMINCVVVLMPPQNMTLPFTWKSDRWWSWRTWWRNVVLHIEMYFSSLDVQNWGWWAGFWWSPEFDCNCFQAFSMNENAVAGKITEPRVVFFWATFTMYCGCEKTKKFIKKVNWGRGRYML